jgi:regulator of nucleoside diphosphate kinase
MVFKRKILVTIYDLMRLSRLLPLEKTACKESENSLSKGLRKLLEQAEIITPSDIPPDLITMNSKVRLRDLATGQEMALSLAFPNDADIERTRVSILTPIGLSILGRRVGDEIEGRAKVEEMLYQPEAAGHFHL